MEKHILEAIRLALQGSHKVNITFKRTAADKVKHLLGMNRAGAISLHSIDEATMTAVMMSKKWTDDNHRTLTVTFPDKFDKNWFFERMRHALDKIEVVN